MRFNVDILRVEDTIPFTSDHQHPPGREFPGFVDHRSLQIGRRALTMGKNFKSRLVKLAPELRNRVYELALIEPHAIDVHPTGISQPGLLRVNRQIRAEATRMYYTTNKFHLPIQDYDGAAFAPFHQIYHRYSDHKNVSTSIDTSLAGLPNWQSLRLWLRAVHARKMWGIDWVWDGNDQTKELAAVATLFSTLHETMGKLPGDEVDRILSSLRAMLTLHDLGWKND